jgi:hypothetical protein
MRDGIHDFYDAWNRHDAAAITAAIVAGEPYADPLTVVDLDGTKLTEHLQSVLEVIRDLRITVLRTISAEDATAAVWRIEGIWDGKLGLLTASETAVRFEGTDMFEFGDGALQRVRRSYDQLAVADALQLPTSSVTFATCQASSASSPGSPACTASR